MEVANTLDACVSANKSSSATFKIEAAVKACNSAAKKVFEEAGGRPEEFPKAKREAAIEMLGDVISTCATDQMANLTSLGKTPSDADKERIGKACRAKNKNTFEEAGGRAEDLAAAEAEAARKNLKETNVYCIERHLKANSGATKLSARKACNQEKMDSFVLAGGDKSVYYLAEEKGLATEMDETLEALVESSVVVADNATDAKQEEEYGKAFNAKLPEARDAFVNAGGDAKDFNRKMDDNRKTKAASTAIACIKEHLAENEGLDDIYTANDAQIKAAREAVKPVVKKEVLRRGGKAAEVDDSIDEGARLIAGDAMAACMGDMDPAVIKDQDVKACKVKANKVLKIVGMDVPEDASKPDLETDEAMAKAADSAVADSARSCKAVGGADCKKVASDAYVKYGADVDRKETAMDEAASTIAVRDRMACAKGCEDDECKKNCDTQSKEIYESADVTDASRTSEGKKTRFNRNVVRRGAAMHATMAFKSCMFRELTPVAKQNDGKLTATQFLAGSNKCKPVAKDAFLNSGGSATLFDATFQEQVGMAKTVALRGCRRGFMTADGKNVDRSESKACEGPIEAMAALLDPTDALRKNRSRADGVQTEVANVAAACKRGNGTECAEKAKKMVEKAGGDPDKAAEYIKQGQGKMGAERMSSCMKPQDATQAKTDKAADDCFTAAKAEHKAEGGDENEFWADGRRGMEKLALEKYRVEMQKLEASERTDDAKVNEKVKEAQTYYENELNGDPSDWDDERFKKEAKYVDQELTYKKDKRVEMKVSMKDANLTVDEYKPMKDKLEASIEEEVNNAQVKGGGDTDMEVTASCGEPSKYGSKMNIVCKIDAGDATKAGNLETRVRHAKFPEVLGAKFTEKAGGRRLNAPRHLSTAYAFETEASQELSIDEAEADAAKANTDTENKNINNDGNTGNDGNDNGNTGNDNGNTGNGNTRLNLGGGNSPSSSGEEEDLLSVSSTTTVSLLSAMFTCLAVYLLQEN